MILCEPCVCSLPANNYNDVRMSLQRCFNYCLMYFGVNAEYVLNKRRNRERVQIRQMSIYACCIYTPSSLKSVGNFFGGKDHTTIIYAKQTIDDLCETDTEIKQTFENLKKFVKQKYFEK